ncbi:hypothetical protein Kpol_1007p10 [Vanderwaltozyma polyspora DSM 70294]|uniref:RNA helicase n=1 Tax=Vanderwaltozyma polyspora (strain ATCC 22028 / DSM 70294 / BCRC 21397 / CBS 2163 / NBRC 10782 / NRRL Y-8283 / UCD 57-17) TaxID=436907 RepID=A7TRT2_VANPO|nr:uncharacterized protein Kpol_1007p10 [Vanderwaltozyma polyspora DSM 70294]EDO15026.1 hypothetical protein Kpol_1007p10 [Vanderwaltozyma polyspora DSM 70294]
MARPANINQLLSSIKKGKNNEAPSDSNNDAYKVVKPKFLDKAKREKINEQNQLPEAKNGDISKYNIVIGNKKSRQVDDGVRNNNDIRLVDNEKQSSKFQFNWNEQEDTLSNYNPIVGTSVSDLIKNNGNKHSKKLDSFEHAYMGKHWKEKSLSEMSERDWRILSEDYHITTKGGNILHPMRNWDELGLIPNDLLEVLKNKLNFISPSPIQRISIPNICQKNGHSTNRDLMGIASTGSGKTLAFVIPILIKLLGTAIRPLSLKVIEGPKALILAPTRELAQQIQAEIKKILSLSSNELTKITSICIVGGHSIEEISYDLSKGCDILVATPGRLIDCLESHLIVIDNVNTIVLDEADKMIDFGFEDQVTTILSKLQINEMKDNLQKIMFTATMTPTIERIANGYLRNASYVSIGNSEEFVPHINQLVYYSPNENSKFRKLKQVLELYPPPVIIFINYKKTADWLATKLQEETNFKVTTLHGSKSQDQREYSLNLLRTGRVQIMIATNVAARGIDIPNVGLVVNYQISDSFEDYIHRIGRTGRAGKEGTAISFVGDDEDPKVIIELFKYMTKKDKESKNKPVDNRFDDLIKQKYNLNKLLSSKDNIIH